MNKQMSDQPGCPCSICGEDYMNRSDSRDSAGQSADDVLKTSKHHADLRNRIAAALSDELSRQQYAIDPKRHPRDPWRWQWFDMQAVADAVIRELGLRMDTTCHIHDREGKQRCHRYVTKWTADE